MSRLVSASPGAIGITLGDPSGVGPEIIAASIGELSDERRRRLVVFCDKAILARAFAQRCGTPVPDDLEVVDRGGLTADKAPPGVPTLEGAQAQVAYLEAAVSAARAGTIAGVVTAPISKTQAKRAGFAFPGHTEFLAQRLGSDRVVMMFCGPTFKVALATVHMGVAEVSGNLTVEGVAGTTVLASRDIARDFGIAHLRVGVVALNPHAGEGGQFGREEIDVIAPAIEEARRQLGSDFQVSGPLIPDAAFRAAAEGAYDLLVAMYHDQALIPVKLVDFEGAINVTAGLPIVRTSPDHGVAYDIAGTGKARAGSFAAALSLAFDLVERR